MAARGLDDCDIASDEVLDDCDIERMTKDLKCQQRQDHAVCRAVIGDAEKKRQELKWSQPREFHMQSTATGSSSSREYV